MTYPFTPLLIAGEQRPSSTGRSFDVRSPHSQRVIGQAAAASAQDCQDAIEAADITFASWEHSSLKERQEIFIKAAGLLEKKDFQEEIASVLKDEVAATQELVLYNIAATAYLFLEAAGSIAAMKGESFPTRAVSGGYVLTQRRAMGVIYAVASWNVPLSLSLRAVAIPIICGNTVVMKTSEVCPRSQSMIGRMFHKAGLPAGVLNIISIANDDVVARTAEIIAHPAVRKINFTGGDRVAKSIATEAAKYLKPCLFELGGKAPVIVLEDANINEAARAIVSAALCNSGQICMSTERVIVQRNVSRALSQTLQNLFRDVKTCAPGESGGISSLISEESAVNVVSMMKEAQADGAEVLVGDLVSRGALVNPHLLRGVKPGMRLWDRESFGPVAAIVVVDTVEEAITMANATEYTLMASLWTENVHVAFDVSSRLRYGTINVNGQTFHTEGQMAGLGGASGYGRFSVEEFTNDRVITFHPTPLQRLPLVD